MNGDAFDTAGKLGLALFLGGMIGIERESHHRPAGFRTHMIVCLGACLFMLVSLRMAELDPRGADPGRIASQVVPGIGFLGAGTILKTGLSVKGLTTAACLWTSAAIGLAVGAGYWVGALLAAGLTLVAIFAFRGVERRLFGDGSVRRFTLRAKDPAGLLAGLEAAIREARAELKGVDVHRREDAADVIVRARMREGADVEDLSRRLRELPGVENVET